MRASDAASDLACGDQLVTQPLANGASWLLCVRVQPYEGLTLEDVEFRPATGDREYTGYKRILDSLYLAQLNVPYDNGAITYNDVTDYGLGGDHLLSQTPETCTGQTRPVTNVSTTTGSPKVRTIPGICLAQVSTGLAYESREWSVDAGPRYAAQGTALQISSLSKVGWYEYQQLFTLDDEGGIDIGLGATGDVAPGDAPGVFFSTDPANGWELGPAADGKHYYAASHWHNAIYRVDFGIDTGGDAGAGSGAGSGQTQQVQEWDYTSSQDNAVTTLGGTPTNEDHAFIAAPTGAHANISWWRVLNPGSLNPDGHPRSYQIVDDNPLDVDSPLTSWPIAFTNANPCEQDASANLDPECPNESVLDYVADDQAPLTDPVAWVNVDFHHVDRDEDQSPMHTHWQHFQLIPRDFFAQGPATPDGRACIDGPGTIDSAVRPCVATNQTLPAISASAAHIVAGTTLTASSGAWNQARTTWDYAYLWFRDGRPITGKDADGNPTAATDQTYVVTPADAGHSLTVKVTASHPGYVSGTAASAAVLVPGGRSTTTVSARPTSYGNAARVVVTVRGVTAIATGTVRLTGVGAAQSGSLSGGKVVFVLPRTLAVGAHALTATYSGNAALVTSNHRQVIRIDKRAADNPGLRIKTRPTRTKAGRAIVTVSHVAGLATPTGKVTVSVQLHGTSKRVTGTLRSGKVTVKLPRLPKKGRWSVRARYLGNSTYTARTSSTLKVVVR